MALPIWSKRQSRRCQPVYVIVNYLFYDSSIIVIKHLAILCYPYSSDPLVEVLFSICTQVPNVLGVFGLNLWMLDSKTVLGRWLEFRLPFHTIIDLKIGIVFSQFETNNYNLSYNVSSEVIVYGFRSQKLRVAGLKPPWWIILQQTWFTSQVAKQTKSLDIFFPLGE